jgi:hypothetical protein
MLTDYFRKTPSLSLRLRSAPVRACSILVRSLFKGCPMRLQDLV